MIKRNHLVLFSLAIIATVLAARYFFRPEVHTVQKKQEPAQHVNLKEDQIDGLKKGRFPASIPKANINNRKAANIPSHEWREQLEKTLKAQGGNSFVWSHEGVPLHVESVIVTLKNDKNSVTTFKVLVDAQTGKILKNWDQPVLDPANPRHSFRVKLDPRYHAD
jgi:hypothetical protein